MPGKPCQIEPLEDWTSPEKWVWQQVCEGKIADFNKIHDYLDPAKTDGWSNERLISPEYLETILLHEPFQSSLHRQGVRISGAWFKKPVNLSHARITCPLHLTHSRYEGEVDFAWIKSEASIWFGHSFFVGRLILDDAKVDGVLNMTGAKFTAKLDMTRLMVGSSLFMRDGAEFDEVILLGAKIGNQVDMSGGIFSGKLNMDGLSVGSSLFMRNGAKFDEVILLGAKITDQLDMSGGEFSGKLNMDGLIVGSSLFMRNGAKFGEVILLGAKVGDQLDMSDGLFIGKLNMANLYVNSNLYMRNEAEFSEVTLLGAKVGGQLSMIGALFTKKLDMSKLDVNSDLYMRDGAKFDEVTLLGAKVGGQLDMSGGKFSGNLNMSDLNIGSSLYLCYGAEFKQDVNLIFTNIRGNLDLSKGIFTSLDLTGAHVQGELRLGVGKESKPVWQNDSRLILRDAVVNNVSDSGEAQAWPEHLELGGFQYNKLGGLVSDGLSSGISSRKASWFIKWLAEDSTYTPQPYQHLAEMLKNMGHVEQANAVLYAGKERELSESTGFKWFGLSMLKTIIGYGYGYRYFRVLWWVLAFTLFGAWVFDSVPQAQNAAKTIPELLGFSFDLLLPLVQLDSAHKIDFDGLQRYYFYLHKLIGFILGSFVIAGLSGITKK